VFTGDVVEAAEVEVIEALVDELHDRGLGPRKYSPAPGNHDIYPSCSRPR
jgi:3',5'-cyclic AMP phosphodiesterase CpdA